MSGFPLIQNGVLHPAIKVLTDYPRDDLASDEVHQALVLACAQEAVQPYNLDVGAIPSMDTVVAGFKTAQLALNSQLGFGHIVQTNCAPRKNIVTTKSKGERLVLGILPNGVTLLVVNAGYSLAAFRNLAQSKKITFFETSVPDSGSQFRSRDYFPKAAAVVAAHLQKQALALGAAGIQNLLAAGNGAEIFKDLALVKDPIHPDQIPVFETGRVWYIDNFGNMKLNLYHEDLIAQHASGTAVALCVGGHVQDAVVGQQGFSQGEGTLALTCGSSGWQDFEGTVFRFSEIFLRGGSAVQNFGHISHGEFVYIVDRAVLQDVIALLRQSDDGLAETLGLYALPEARLIKMIARAGLIENGFDDRKLRAAVDDKTLLDLLKKVSD